MLSCREIGVQSMSLMFVGNVFVDNEQGTQGIILRSTKSYIQKYGTYFDVFFQDECDDAIRIIIKPILSSSRSKKLKKKTTKNH